MKKSKKNSRIDRPQNQRREQLVAAATEGEVQQKEAVGTNHSSAVVAQQTPAEAGTIL
jgi:hypothetical protein